MYLKTQTCEKSIPCVTLIITIVPVICLLIFFVLFIALSIFMIKILYFEQKNKIIIRIKNISHMLLSTCYCYNTSAFQYRISKQQLQKFHYQFSQAVHRCNQHLFFVSKKIRRDQCLDIFHLLQNFKFQNSIII